MENKKEIIKCIKCGHINEYEKKIYLNDYYVTAKLFCKNCDYEFSDYQKIKQKFKDFVKEYSDMWDKNVINHRNIDENSQMKVAFELFENALNNYENIIKSNN